MRLTWRTVGISAGLLAIALGAWVLMGRYVPIASSPQKTISQMPQQATQPNQPVVRWDALITQPELKRRYRVKRIQDLIGFHFVHLENRKTPQQVIIAERVPPASAALLFDPQVNLDMIGALANQLMALRKRKNAEQLTIENFKSVSETPLVFQGRALRQREVHLQIQLQTESKPRTYVATVIQYDPAHPDAFQSKRIPNDSDFQTVIVTFAKPDKFDAALVLDLLKHDKTLASQDASTKPAIPKNRLVNGEKHS